MKKVLENHGPNNKQYIHKYDSGLTLYINIYQDTVRSSLYYNDIDGYLFTDPDSIDGYIRDLQDIKKVINEQNF